MDDLPGCPIFLAQQSLFVTTGPSFRACLKSKKIIDLENEIACFWFVFWQGLPLLRPLLTFPWNLLLQLFKAPFVWEPSHNNSILTMPLFSSKPTKSWWRPLKDSWTTSISQTICNCCFLTGAPHHKHHIILTEHGGSRQCLQEHLLPCN